MWTGMSLAGLSTVTLGLYAVYQTLSGTFTGLATDLGTGPVAITVVVLVLGLALSGIGSVAASRQRKRGRTARREETRSRVAA